jgi:hypothetical protein
MLTRRIKADFQNDKPLIEQRCVWSVRDSDIGSLALALAILIHNRRSMSDI